MENTEVIEALRCGGHNMIFHYCDKEDCPYCQYSYHDNLYRCNVQELGIDAANALEADEQQIADLQKQVNEFIKNETHSSVIKAMSKQIAEQQKQIAQLYILLNNRINEIAELEAQLPKEGEWINESESYKWYGQCPWCNHEFSIDSYYADMNYCPNCGAKMKFNDKQKTESKNTKSSLEYDYCGTPKYRYDIEVQNKRVNDE